MAEDRLGDRAEDPLYDPGCRRSRARDGVVRGLGTVISPAFGSGVDNSESNRSARFWAGIPAGWYRWRRVLRPSATGERK